MNPPALPLPPSQPPAWDLGTEQPHQFIRGRQPHRAVWGINQTMRRKRKEKKKERERGSEERKIREGGGEKERWKEVGGAGVRSKAKIHQR